MTPYEFWKTKPREEHARVAKEAKTTVANIQQIALGGSVGSALAERLAKASGGAMTELEILYPERFSPQKSSAA